MALSAENALEVVELALDGLEEVLFVELVFEVDGENVTVVLNGKTILATSVKDLPTDGTTPDGKPHPGLHNPSGYVGFLGHTMPVRFRDIRVKELP